jgi:hypothetical protein
MDRFSLNEKKYYQLLKERKRRRIKSTAAYSSRTLLQHHAAKYEYARSLQSLYAGRMYDLAV